MRFNTLLREAGVDPGQVVLLFHNTDLQPLRSALSTMWRERPDLLAAWQAVHHPQVESSLRGHAVMASFAPLDRGRHLFIGLFDLSRHEALPVEAIYADPRYGELEETYGATDTTLRNNLRFGTQTSFLTEPLDAMADLRGRLVVATPPDRTTDVEVLAVTEAQGEGPMPEWRRLRLSATQVRSPPRDWALHLADWQGIYLIVDEADGDRYVGSASGVGGFLARWQQHVAREAEGVTARLRERDPSGFSFSILERVADMVPAEVSRLEQTWMDRLHTRRFGLNAGAPALAERNGND